MHFSHAFHLPFDNLAREIRFALDNGQQPHAARLAMLMRSRYGPVLPEACAISADALEKCGFVESALDAWDALARNWPDNRELVETAILKAWGSNHPKTRQKAAEWLEMWRRIFIRPPGIAFLLRLLERGCKISGSIGIHNRAILGWLWVPNGQKPAFRCDGAELAIEVRPVASGEAHTLYTLRSRLPASSSPYLFAAEIPGQPPVEGSPLVCFPAAAAAPANIHPEADGAVCVVVPVFDDRAATLSCLASVFASRKRNRARIAVFAMWDHGPDPRLLQDLERLAARRLIQLRKTAFNCGFLGCVNQALSLIPGGDVILLNSDTLVHGDWVDRLRAVARARPDCATVTAMGSEAEHLSFPSPQNRGAVRKLSQTAIIDAACANVSPSYSEVPSAVGFCMLLTRKGLTALHGFDGLSIHKGYSEEVEYSLRAAAMGFKNYAAWNVFVAHVQGRSFGPAKRPLVAQNNACIKACFPDHPADYDAFLQENCGGPARQEASLAALEILRDHPPLQLLPWSRAELPVWKLGEKKQAALFVLPLGSGVWRARLRVIGETPLADIDFLYPADRAKLVRAVDIFGCAASWPEISWLTDFAVCLGLKKLASASPSFVPVSSRLAAGPYLVVPPLSLSGFDKLRRRAARETETIFYMPDKRRQLGALSVPPNVLDLPDVEDLTPLGIRSWLAEDPVALADWQEWARARNLNGLEVSFLGARDAGLDIDEREGKNLG